MVIHYLRFFLCHALYLPRTESKCKAALNAKAICITDDPVLEGLKRKEVEKAEAKKEKEVKRIETERKKKISEGK